MTQTRIPWLAVLTIVGAVVLFVSSVGLVTSQYRVRSLVSQIERLQNESKRLNDDASELNMEISRAALPGYIATQARKAGLEPATAHNTVVLEYKPISGEEPPARKAK